MPTFLELPTDVYLSILEHAFVVEDILSLRKTCRKMYIATRERSVWQAALRIHVLNQDMPVPRLKGPVESLSDEQLERCVIRATRLRRNWSSPSPVHRPLIRIHPSNQPEARNISSHFITGKLRQKCLLTLTLVGSHSALDCWELGPKLPSRIGHRKLSNVRGFAYNGHGKSKEAVAICFHDGAVEILSIDFGAEDPESALVTSKRFRVTSAAKIPAFQGTHLLLQYQSGRLDILDTTHPECHAELVCLSESPEEAMCMAAVFIKQVTVVFRHKSIELYDISQVTPGSASGLWPLSTHVWQWGADKINVMALPQWPDTHSSTNTTTYLPITILLRHSSIYPWPVNIIHQYTLHSNNTFDPSLPFTADNSPYDIVPRTIRSMSSPVQLTSITQMALGSYGTGIWFDNYAEDYYGPGAGQRLAGIFTSLPPHSGSDDDDDDDSDNQHGTVAATTSVPQIEASSIFATRRQDVWVSIALDEQEGRIALGRADGSVELLEYE